PRSSRCAGSSRGWRSVERRLRSSPAAPPPLGEQEREDRGDRGRQERTSRTLQRARAAATLAGVDRAGLALRLLRGGAGAGAQRMRVVDQAARIVEAHRDGRVLDPIFAPAVRILPLFAPLAMVASSFIFAGVLEVTALRRIGKALVLRVRRGANPVVEVGR